MKNFFVKNKNCFFQNVKLWKVIRRNRWIWELSKICNYSSTGKIWIFHLVRTMVHFWQTRQNTSYKLYFRAFAISVKVNDFKSWKVRYFNGLAVLSNGICFLCNQGRFLGLPLNVVWKCPGHLWVINYDWSFLTGDAATFLFSKIRTWIDLAAYNSRKECDRGCIIWPHGWMTHNRWVIPSWVKVLFWHLYLHVRKVYWCTLECYRYLLLWPPFPYRLLHNTCDPFWLIYPLLLKDRNV